MKRLAAIAGVAIAGLGIAILGLAIIIVARTLLLPATHDAPAAPIAPIPLDIQAAAGRLSGAIRFATVSPDNSADRDARAFLDLHAYLGAGFPNVSRTLTRETVAGYSLLYTWRGTRPDLPAIVFSAHLDVVPADQTPGANAASMWTHPPFEGAIDTNGIWGRGALDDKGAVLGLLEAVDALIQTGFAPARTIYLAFGHNEEVDETPSGAAEIARLLGARGVHDAWLLDEGGFVVDGAPGVDRPVAFVGVTEKTTLSLELRVDTAGGHASMPPRETAVGVLAGAIDRLEHDPMPARLDGPVLDMFTTLAPYMRWPMRALFANLWLTRPLVVRQMAAEPRTNALIRTTMAPTMVEGSSKSNVLPVTARAIVNVRLAPGDAPADVTAHATSAINDGRVAIRMLGGSEPPPALSSTSTPEFAALARAIRAVYPDAIVAPFVTTGATDSRRYRAIAANAYRFLPVRQDDAIEELHGVNEHIRLDVYGRQIQAYATIIRQLAEEPSTRPRD